MNEPTVNPYEAPVRAPPGGAPRRSQPRRSATLRVAIGAIIGTLMGLLLALILFSGDQLSWTLTMALCGMVGAVIAGLTRQRPPSGDVVSREKF